MALHKNVLILIMHNVSVYSVKQSYYYSNAILGSKILIAQYWTKSNKTKQRWQLYTNNFG